MTILIVLTLVVALVSVLGAYLTAVVVAAGELRRANTHSHAQVPDGPGPPGRPHSRSEDSRPVSGQTPQHSAASPQENRWGIAKCEIS